MGYLHQLHYILHISVVADFNTCTGQVEANVCVRPEPHLEAAQLQTSGFSINGARVDMSSPPLDMAFHLVYRNRSNPKPSPVFDMSYEVDRSGSPTPEVSNAYQVILILCLHPLIPIHTSNVRHDNQYPWLEQSTTSRAW